jgi:hypothetical protein
MASTPSLLSPQMRAGLFDLPTDHDEVQRRYTLVPEDMSYAGNWVTE